MGWHRFLRSSPSTMYDINGACYITSTGYATDVGYSIPNSYGISFYTKKFLTFALRASTTTPTTLRATFTRMATSTSTTMGLGFPAGGGALRSTCISQKCMVSIWRVLSRKMAIFSLMKTLLWLSISTEIYQFLIK